MAIFFRTVIYCVIVRVQKPIEFINKCNCIVDYSDLEKAILWYTNKPVARLKTIYLHGRYPAVSIHKEKIHVHRLLMMYWEQRKLRSEEYVHHKDGNKLNALRENLEILYVSEHQSLHNKGKKLTESHKNKISNANRKRKGMKYKKRRNIPLDELRILLDKGWSVNKIAKHFNVDWSTIRNRIYENPELLEGENETD